MIFRAITCALRGHQLQGSTSPVASADLMQIQNSSGEVLGSITGPTFSYLRCSRCKMYERSTLQSGGSIKVGRQSL